MYRVVFFDGDAWDSLVDRFGCEIAFLVAVYQEEPRAACDLCGLREDPSYPPALREALQVAGIETPNDVTEQLFESRAFIAEVDDDAVVVGTACRNCIARLPDDTYPTLLTMERRGSLPHRSAGAISRGDLESALALLKRAGEG